MAITKGEESFGEEGHEELLRLVKSQLKAIMEESVTKTFIYVESPHVLRLSGTVERCLLDGIKTPPYPFHRNKIAYLFTKVGKVIPEVAKVAAKTRAVEASLEKLSMGQGGRFSSVTNSKSGSFSGNRHLWVRMAITEKVIDKIIDYLVTNHSVFYKKSSIMADPLRGKLLSSLLVGPCALDYTKMKTQNHYWVDPPAEELLRRHKLHSRAPPTHEKRPALGYSSSQQRSVSECAKHGSTFRDYVDSLHQNSKITLLYGKNNVAIELEDIGIVRGYLSLHQEPSRLVVKWAPNELIYGADPDLQFSHSDRKLHPNGDLLINSKLNHNDDIDGVPKSHHHSRTSSADKRSISSYWNQAIFIDVQEIVYLHCHQKGESNKCVEIFDDQRRVKVRVEVKDTRFTLVLVGQDGVQWPPFHFPPGGQLLCFLTSLETALFPQGCLDPPLQSQKGKSALFPQGQQTPSLPLELRKDSHETTDFVFRVSTSLDYNSGRHGKPARVSPSRFDLMQSVFTFPSLWSRSFTRAGKKPTLSASSKTGISRSVVTNRESGRYSTLPNSMRERHRSGGKINSWRDKSTPDPIESNAAFVPNLDMYAWESDEQRHYNEPSVSGETSGKERSKLARSALKTLCDSMRRQIISRAFYGWLTHCRHLATVRTHFTSLVNAQVVSPYFPTDARVGITEEVWDELTKEGKLTNLELSRHVYFGGVKAKRLRKTVWLYLLGYYPTGCSEKQSHEINVRANVEYKEIRLLDQLIKKKVSEMSPEEFTRNGGLPNGNDSMQALASAESSMSGASFPRANSNLMTLEELLLQMKHELDRKLSISEENNSLSLSCGSRQPTTQQPLSTNHYPLSLDPGSVISMKKLIANEDLALRPPFHDDSMSSSSDDDAGAAVKIEETQENDKHSKLCNGAPKTSTSVSPATGQLISSWDPSENALSLNVSQIDKDVYRCDRDHDYFTRAENLTKLRNVMSCYVWQHPQTAYVQGMCDLVAPLLILFDDESIVFACFNKLMERIPFRKSLETRLTSLKSLLKVLDEELYAHLCKDSDDAYFFFCYRWFLLEFKRELSYDEDIFAVWERSWAARDCTTRDFSIFLALAMLETYRDIILENKMDFSSIVKFFNEMAEKHDAEKLVKLAQKLVADVQCMIEK